MDLGVECLNMKVRNSIEKPFHFIESDLYNVVLFLDIDIRHTPLYVYSLFGNNFF